MYGKAAPVRDKDTFVFGIWVVYLFTFGFLMGLWGASVNISDTHFEQTLSYLIAHYPYTRTLYIIWYFFYAFLSFILLWSVVTRDLAVIENDEEEKYKNYFCNYELKTKTYIFCSFLYVACTILKLFGYFLLWNYPVTTDNTLHMIWTGIAVICSVMSSLLLFVRRFCMRLYTNFHKSSPYILSCNGVLICVQVALLISFGVDDHSSAKGALEFALAISLCLDPVFQIVDIMHDIVCEHTQAHHDSLLRGKAAVEQEQRGGRKSKKSSKVQPITPEHYMRGNLITVDVQESVSLAKHA